MTIRPPPVRGTQRRKPWWRTTISHWAGLCKPCPARQSGGRRPSSSLRTTRRTDRTMSTRTAPCVWSRSEEHTSELQSRLHLVCRLLLEKKKRIMLDSANDPLAWRWSPRHFDWRRLTGHVVG